MKCLICGSESANEVCNKCIRLEKILYQKEWNFKEGMLIKKTEAFRIAISNLRISGRAAICDNPKGLNARIDNISYYLLNVKECSRNISGKEDSDGFSGRNRRESLQQIYLSARI